jgi:hypothetical protein
VTSSVWMIIGALFLLRPAVGVVWRWFGGLHLIQFSFLALIGFVAWVEALQLRSRGVSTDLTSGFTLFVLGTISTILTWASLRISPPHDDSVVPRGLCVALQTLAVLVAWAYLLHRRVLPSMLGI